MNNRRIHPALSKYEKFPIGIIDISIPFHDVDMLEVVWHGHYMKYFEIARCAVLQAIDYDISQMEKSGYVWPIVDIRLRYISPVKYGDCLQVAAVITEWDLRLKVNYFAINRGTRKVVARGQSVQAPVQTETNTMAFGCPELLAEKIAEWRKLISSAQ